jgi:ligand-binding sensor domain-containing protein/DNA-binding CsgD family transcriptional regulator
MNFKAIKVFLILGLALLSIVEIRSESLYMGLPRIWNFSRLQYSGGIQNWSFAETDNGFLYVANNSGLLEYDGTHWALYKSIQAVHRSVCADGNRIYVGAFNEFGYYEANKNGILVYHSLIHLVKGRILDFDEIWRIHKTPYGIVFQSFRAIFIYRDEKIEIVYPQSSFKLSYYVNDILWVYDESKGLMQYQEGKLRTVPGCALLEGQEIWSILPLNKDEVIIGTKNNGIYRYDGQKVVPWGKEINEQLKKYQLYSAKKLKNNFFAFGTIQNGLIVADQEGNQVFEMNKERGLQNNTVLGIGQDYRGNIWLCLDNGISMIEFDSPISFFQYYFDIGTGYASAKFKDNIYLGTNQGLFCVKEKDFIEPSKTKASFKLISGTEGQVWNLSIIDNTLLCGHNDGVFQVVGDQAIKISSVPGTWNFLKINNTSLALVGSYTGLLVLENRDGFWHFRNRIKGFSESSRFVQYDKTGVIWVSQTYKGIFRIKTDFSMSNVLDLKLYNSKSGLPSDQSNLLFKIQSEIVVASINGIYSFNDKAHRFEKMSKFSAYLNEEKWIDYLYQDSGQNIWFSADNHLGVLRLQEDGSFKKVTLPFLKLANMLIPSFESIQELDQKNILIGVEGGFANYVPKYKKDYDKKSIVYISDFRSRDTAEGIYRLNSNNSSQEVIPEIKYKNNTVSISFSASNFEAAEMCFQYRLIGFDEKWSEWTSQNLKEYTNLPEGHYTFLVRANNYDQTVPTELSFRFTVLPPWYRSVYALIVYLVLFIVLVSVGKKYLSLRIRKSHFTENQKQQEKFLARERELKEEALIAEKELQQLRNETLNFEMLLKEKELANSTMLIIKKNNILRKLQNDLRDVSPTIGDDNAKTSIKNLIKRLDKEIDNEKQWKVFDMHVEQVYEELFKKLKERFPDLTPRELSLCAYLRMNISTKEIATLMNISARGVEISRYRVRKKLKLDREANLTEFMLNL